MALHLDKATKEEYKTIRGLGDQAYLRVKNHIDNHGSFRSWAEFKNCATNVTMEDMKELHSKGIWTSNIPEFQELTPKQEDAAEGGKMAAASIEASEEATVQEMFAKILTKLDGYDTKIASVETSVGELTQELTSQIQELGRRQKDSEMKVVGIDQKFDAKIEALERLVRTTKVTEKHMAKQNIPFAASSVNTGDATKELSRETRGQQDRESATGISSGTYIIEDNLFRGQESDKDGSQQLSYRSNGRGKKQQEVKRNMDVTKVTVDNFDGKVGQWDNWFHKFTFMANTCGWNDHEKLFKLTASLSGNALTAHRNLPFGVCHDYKRLCEALEERYGKKDTATKSALRADLTTVQQKEDEDLEVYADRVYAMTMDAYPAETPVAQLQQLAVEHFLNGCKDKGSAWLTYNIKDPRTVTEAVSQMKMAQASSRRMGVKPAARRVTFEEATTEVRRIETGDTERRCYECGGKGHMARDCANNRNRNRCRYCDSGNCRGDCNWRRRSPSPRQGSRQSTGRWQNRDEERYRGRNSSPGEDYDSYGQQRYQQSQRYSPPRDFGWERSGGRRSYGDDSPRRGYNDDYRSSGSRDQSSRQGSYDGRRSDGRRNGGDRRDSRDRYFQSGNVSRSPSPSRSIARDVENGRTKPGDVNKEGAVKSSESRNTAKEQSSLN
jgi:hypothetical protein